MRTGTIRLMAAVALLALLACANQATAQTVPGIPDSLWVWLDDDSTTVARRNTRGEIFPAEWFTAGYKYQMYADTTCETDYQITGFKVNGRRWRLLHWKGWRIINADAPFLNYNSRTVDTVVHAGDTLSFYRDLSWRNPLTGQTLTNNYLSFDTLTYSVDLNRAADNARIVLLDSIGVLPRVPHGVPIIHGMRPMMAHVKWIVPASLDGERVFLRVRVNHRGAGQYWFTRMEEGTRSKWLAVTDPFWQRYLAYFGQALAKPVLERQAAAAAMLDVRMMQGSSDAVAITFTTAPDAPTSLAIHDVAGNLVFFPYSAAVSNGESERVEYRFTSSGVYLISLAHGNRTVSTQTITIGR